MLILKLKAGDTIAVGEIVIEAVDEQSKVGARFTAGAVSMDVRNMGDGRLRVAIDAPRDQLILHDRATPAMSIDR